MKLLVCGGAGFIGSNFVRVRLRSSEDEIIVLDKLTYAGRRESLRDVEESSRSSIAPCTNENRELSSTSRRLSRRPA